MITKPGFCSCPWLSREGVWISVIAFRIHAWQVDALVYHHVFYALTLAFAIGRTSATSLLLLLLLLLARLLRLLLLAARLLLLRLLIGKKQLLLLLQRQLARQDAHVLAGAGLLLRNVLLDRSWQSSRRHDDVGHLLTRAHGVRGGSGRSSLRVLAGICAAAVARVGAAVAVWRQVAVVWTRAAHRTILLGL